MKADVFNTNVHFENVNRCADVQQMRIYGWRQIESESSGISLYKLRWLKITWSRSDLITVNEIVFTVNSHLIEEMNRKERENMRWTAWN